MTERGRMVPSAIANEMTTAIRYFGTGVESQGRALGSSVRHLALAASDVQIPANQVLGFIAFALRASSSLLEIEDREVPSGGLADYDIVDKDLTRC